MYRKEDEHLPQRCRQVELQQQRGFAFRAHRVYPPSDLSGVVRRGEKHQRRVQVDVQHGLHGAWWPAMRRRSRQDAAAAAVVVRLPLPPLTAPLSLQRSGTQPSPRP